MKSIEQKVDRVRQLEANWDGYGAPPISRDAIDKAEACLDTISVVPCAEGGVQLEWHTEHFDVEIEFRADGTVHSSIEATMGPK